MATGVPRPDHLPDHPHRPEPRPAAEYTIPRADAPYIRVKRGSNDAQAVADPCAEFTPEKPPRRVMSPTEATAEQLAGAVVLSAPPADHAARRLPDVDLPTKPKMV